jgi:hypothetical protein
VSEAGVLKIESESEVLCTDSTALIASHFPSDSLTFTTSTCNEQPVC